jgi:hypothetical protein
MQDTLLTACQSADVSEGWRRHIIWQSAAESPSVSDAEFDKAVDEVDNDENLLAPRCRHGVYLAHCALWLAFVLTLIRSGSVGCIDLALIWKTSANSTDRCLSVGTCIIVVYLAFLVEVAVVTTLRGAKVMLRDTYGRIDLICLLLSTLFCGAVFSHQLPLSVAQSQQLKIATLGVFACRFALPLGRACVGVYSTARSVRDIRQKHGSIAFDTDFNAPSVTSSAATTPRNSEPKAYT